jgi:hypothetical protein
MFCVREGESDCHHDGPRSAFPTPGDLLEFAGFVLELASVPRNARHGKVSLCSHIFAALSFAYI